MTLPRNLHSAINIATTATAGIPSTVFRYKSIFGTLPSIAVFLDSNAADLTGSHDLTLRFVNDLTNAGGTSPLSLLSNPNPSFETTCANSFCGTVVAPTSYLTAGAVTTNPTATPEPTSFALLSIAAVLGLITGARRSRPINSLGLT